MALAVDARCEPLPQEVPHGLCIAESCKGRDGHVRFEIRDASVLHHHSVCQFGFASLSTSSVSSGDKTCDSGVMIIDSALYKNSSRHLH